MVPTIIQGDLLLIDPVKPCRDGLVALTVTRKDGAAIAVRRLQVQISDGVLALCDNAAYPAEHLTAQKLLETYEGSVIWRAGRL
jgi:SOS-response transcriptional repressor LexA